MRFRMLIVAVALLAMAGACGSKSDEAGAPTGSSTPTATGAAGGACDVTVTGAANAKPVVTIKSCGRQTKLGTKDITAGSGTEAKSGSKVEVQYVGIAASTKVEFDASWNRGQTFPFQLGAGNVIPGWDQGVAGMKVGGRRLLIIPPELGYGEAGAGGRIGPNETLIFVVDLVKVG